MRNVTGAICTNEALNCESIIFFKLLRSFFDPDEHFFYLTSPLAITFPIKQNRSALCMNKTIFWCKPCIAMRSIGAVAVANGAANDAGLAM